MYFIKIYWHSFIIHILIAHDFVFFCIFGVLQVVNPNIT